MKNSFNFESWDRAPLGLFFHALMLEKPYFTGFLVQLSELVAFAEIPVYLDYAHSHEGTVQAVDGMNGSIAAP